MSDYFDRDFFKFLFGFLTIVLISLIIILSVKIYSSSTSPVQVENDCATSGTC